jgi:succinyl-CoA synthetase beta subunit
MEKHGVIVQPGKMAETAEEAYRIACDIKEADQHAELVVKAQIHAGGRGKGTFTNGFKGGVHVVEDCDQVQSLAGSMLGNTLVTKQTGEKGQLCQKVLINKGVDIVEEKYFAILLDRAHDGPVLVGSHKGGMDIEKVAEEDPSDICTIPVDILEGLTDEKAREMAVALGFRSEEHIAQAVQNMRGLYDVFIKTDSTQIEINPLALTSDNQVVAVDAKFNFDDNAAFRQADIFDLRDKTMEDPRDVEAEEVGLNYIGLEGNIGCLVNGAGLAMATMDIIQQHGGSPANFLDVGGSASKDQVAEAFRIVSSDPNVKAILVNIFGGIMRCDVIAEGILQAYEKVKLDIPLIVRLAGTNVEIGRKMLEDSHLPIITADDLDDAAVRSVASA